MRVEKNNPDVTENLRSETGRGGRNETEAEGEL